MIAQLIRALRAAQIDLDPIQIAEAIFLASRMPAAHDRPQPHTAKRTGSEADEPDRSGRRGESPPTGPGSGKHGPSASSEVRVATAPADAVRLYAAPAGGWGAPSAGRIRVSGVAALDRVHEFADALMPFARKRRTGARLVLDEEATVRRYAENFGRVLEPVYTQDAERWFGLTLVVECVPSTELWSLALREFRRILRSYSAFGDIASLQLHADGRDFAVTPWSDSLASRPPASLLKFAPRLEELGAAGDRRLILVFSDCTSDSWHSGALPAALRKIAGRAPVALFHLLPERLWQWTWVQSPEASVSTLNAGVPNARLDVVRPWWDLSEASGGIALPVISFDPRSIANWARAVMAVGTASAPAVLLEAARASAAAPESTRDSLAKQPRDADEILDAFSSWATPVARQLVAYFSATSLTVPIMRLVQSAMLPQATTAHLAEVFLGGLLERAKTPPGVKIPDDQILYDFASGVRERLQTWLSKGEARRVLQVVGQALAARSGKEFSFDAIARADSEVPEDMLPFAEVARALLPRLAEREVDREASVPPPAPSVQLTGPTPANDTFLAVRRRLTLQAASPVRSVKWSPDSRALAIVHEAGVELVDVSGPNPKSFELFDLQQDHVLPRVHLQIFASQEDRADEDLRRVIDLVERILFDVLFEQGRCRAFVVHETDASALRTDGEERTFAVIVGTARSHSLLLAESFFSRARHAQSNASVSLGIWLGQGTGLPSFYSGLPVVTWNQLTTSPRPSYTMRRALADMGTALENLRDALFRPRAESDTASRPTPPWYCSAAAWMDSDKLAFAHAMHYVRASDMFDSPYGIHQVQISRDAERRLASEASTLELASLRHAVVSLEAFENGSLALSDSHGFIHTLAAGDGPHTSPRRSGAGIPLHVFGSRGNPLWGYTNSGGGITVLHEERRLYINLEDDAFVPSPIVDCFFAGSSQAPEVIVVCEDGVLEFELARAGSDGSVPLRTRVPFAPETPARKAAISPDRRYALFVSSSAIATLWDAETWRQISSVMLSSSDGDVPVTSVAFSPDGARVLICVGSQVTVFGTDDLIEAGIRAQRGADQPPMPLPHALDALSSFAMAFHLDRLRADQEEAEKDYFEIEVSTSAETLRTVRGLCEWIFSGLISDYLNGDPQAMDDMRRAAREVIRSDTFGNFLRGFMELWDAYLGVIEGREANRRLQMMLAVAEPTLRHLQRLFPGIESGTEMEEGSFRNALAGRRFTFSIELRDYFQAVRVLKPVVVQAVFERERADARKEVRVYLRAGADVEADRHSLIRTLADLRAPIDIRSADDLAPGIAPESSVPNAIGQADLFICLVGSTHSAELAEEIELARTMFARRGFPRLLVCFKDMPAAAAKAGDPSLPAAALRAKLSREGIFALSYRGADELREQVLLQINPLLAALTPA